MNQAKKSKISFPIKYKFILIVEALILFSIVILSLLHYIEAKDILTKRILSDLTALANAKEDHVNSLLESNFNQALLIASRRIPREYLMSLKTQGEGTEDLRANTLRTLADAKNVVKNMRAIDIIDLKGKIVSSTESDNIGRDLLGNPIFKEGRKKPFLSNLYALQGRFVYDISAPLYNPSVKEKDVIGLVRVLVDAEQLFDITTDYEGLGETGEIALAKHIGGEIVYLNPLRHQKDAALKLRIPFEADSFLSMKLALEKKIGITVNADYRNIEVLSAYRYLPISEWGIVVKIDTKEAFQPIHKLLWNTIILACFIAFLSFIVAFIFSRFMLKPINKLHQGIGVIGAGNLDYKLEIKTNDEIEELADSFNQMALDLKKTTTSIDNLNREISERKRVEDALAGEKERLAVTLLSIGDGVIATDKQGKVTIINKVAEELTGWKSQDAIGKPLENIFNILDQKTRQRTKNPVNRVLETKGIIDLGNHIVLIAKDGKERMIADSGAPIFDKEKNIIGVILVFRDITEQKRAEEIIKRAYQMNRAILEKAPFGVFVVNETGGVDYVNPAMIDISGDTAEQFKKLNMFAVPTYKEKGIDKKIKAVLVGEPFFMGAVDYTSLSGKRTTRNMTGIPYEEEGKKKALIFVEDITSQKKKEEEIRRANEEWVRTFDSISDLVFIQDKDCTIIKANKALAKVLKLSPEKIIGRKCYELLHKTDQPWPGCPFEKSRVDKLNHEEEVDDPNIGIPLLVTISPILDDKGEFIGSVQIAKDISEIRKSQEELERKNAELRKLDQLKSEFVSMVSHELRTPLSITKEGISLILDGIPGAVNEKQQKILETSKNNIDRLARIINELLDISKIEAGKVEIRRESVRINDLVNSIISLFQFKAKEKNLELKINLPEKDIDIYVDADKITEVLTNLLDNAIKFTEKGTVEISIAETEKEVTCTVKDTGIGIAKEDLPKMFDKFQQFSRAVGPGGKGTGLGSAITKGIIELHKGKIWVESELGKGAKFVFSLPKQTYASLTKEYIDLGIKDSSENKTPFSLIIVSVVDFDNFKRQLQVDKLRAILNGMESTIRNNLRRAGDTTLKDTGEFAVFLLDCNKEYALKVEQGLKEALESYLAIQGVADKIRLEFSNTVYPNEAKTCEQILEKVKEGIVKKWAKPGEEKNITGGA